MEIDTMIILVLIPFLLVLLAQIILKITYRKYESIETDTGLTGKEVTLLLDEVNITVNKNAVPNDPEKPTVTSGIRIGSPAMTTKGFTEKEFLETAKIIVEALNNYKNGLEYGYLNERVRRLLNK